MSFWPSSHSILNRFVPTYNTHSTDMEQNTTDMEGSVVQVEERPARVFFNHGNERLLLSVNANSDVSSLIESINDRLAKHRNRQLRCLTVDALTLGGGELDDNATISDVLQDKDTVEMLHHRPEKKQKMTELDAGKENNSGTFDISKPTPLQKQMIKQEKTSMNGVADEEQTNVPQRQQTQQKHGQQQAQGRSRGKSNQDEEGKGAGAGTGAGAGAANTPGTSLDEQWQDSVSRGEFVAVYAKLPAHKIRYTLFCVQSSATISYIWCPCYLDQHCFKTSNSRGLLSLYFRMAVTISLIGRTSAMPILSIWASVWGTSSNGRK